MELAELDGVVDAHVHLMPERLMAAIRNALHDVAGWEFPHPTDRTAVESNLRAAGVDRYVALPYAHKPGIAAELNDWVLAPRRRLRDGGAVRDGPR